MKFIKRLVTGVVLLVVLAAGAAVAAFMYIDSIAKAAIEKGGTYALGVTTTLGGADVEVFAGTFSMTRLDVANPVGFKSPTILSVGDGGVAVSLATLRKPVVELPRLGLRGIRLSLEKSGGQTNYQTIIDNLKKLEQAGSSGGGAGGAGGPGKDEKKFIVREVDIRDVKVHVDLLPEGGQLTQLNITLDSIQLRDVGSETQGLPMRDIVKIVVQALLSAVADKGGGILPADFLGDLQGQLAGLTSLDQLGVKLTSELGKQVEQQVGKVVEEAGRAVEQKVDEATKELEKKAEDALKGLIPGKK